MKSSLFIATALAVFASGRNVTLAAGPLPVFGPLYHEATNEFSAMKVTQYKHATHVDPVAGSYYFDCVGFVSHALQKAAPQAWKSLAKGSSLAPRRNPNPSMYRNFLASLASHPQPGWEAVTNVADLCPGDVVAWRHKTATASGHAVVIGGLPVRSSDKSWVVEVYDSTSSPHGNDSRPADARAQKLATSDKHTGLGHGVMAFIADEAGGAITGLQWSTNSQAITVPIAAGRPTS